MKRRPRSTPATLADIARFAGVHASTVSRALSGSPLVEEAKRQKILKVAQEHGYVVNSTARNLRLKRTQTLGVVIPLGHEAGQALSDPFFVSMLGYLAEQITQRGYGMFLQKVLAPTQDWLVRLIASQRADGIIVIGQSTEHDVLETASKTYLPLVVWGGHLSRRSYCTVGTDNVAGACAAVEHLLQGGRKRVLFLGDASIPEIRLRFEGYRLALARARGTFPEISVAAGMTPDAAYEAMHAYVRKGATFDAVFAATDVIAISAMRSLVASGLSVPGDVAVVGFDDIPMAAYSIPTLTTVRQDLQRGAAILVDLLVRRIDGEDTPSTIMAAKLEIRESSAVQQKR